MTEHWPHAVDIVLLVLEELRLAPLVVDGSIIPEGAVKVGNAIWVVVPPETPALDGYLALEGPLEATYLGEVLDDLLEVATFGGVLVGALEDDEGMNTEENVEDGLDGVTDGVLMRVVDKVLEDVTDGVLDGVGDSITEGVTDGVLEGVVKDSLEGALDGVLNDVVDDVIVGVMEGVMEGVIDKVLDGVVEKVLEEVLDGALDDVLDDFMVLLCPGIGPTE